MTSSGDQLRLTELLASLSLATDAGTGQPLGHGLRTCLLSVRIGRALNLTPQAIRIVHRVSLLRFLGCTADAAETARFGAGDDRAVNAAFAPVLNGSAVEGLPVLGRVVAADRPPLRRALGLVGAVLDPNEPARGLAAHCEVAAMLARRLGLGDEVADALGAGYERWDGKGYPNGLRGDAIPLSIRITMVARDVDLYVSRALDVQPVLARRRGKAYDPAVVDAYRGLSEPHPEATWDEVLDAEPEPVTGILDVDGALEVIADFADLKSPWTRSHSRHVSRISEAAAHAVSLGLAESLQLRRAGLVHDLGRVGVANGIWDKPGPLAVDEWETVRLHAYLTDRIVSRCPQLAELGTLASTHHERLDGSGYHRSIGGGQLTRSARILAAADMFAALLADRPHRPALSLDDASAMIRSEATEGRLDPAAVEAVIDAGGGQKTAVSPASLPDGLTERETEVLQHLCRGSTNRQVAEALYISPKTVGRHVENIYAKIGVSTRAGAAVYAMEHGLLS